MKFQKILATLFVQTPLKVPHGAMRTQRLHKPSKRVLENLEMALERENSARKRRPSPNKGARGGKPPRKQKRTGSGTAGGAKTVRKAQSTFAEFIDNVHEVQTLTHPSNSQGARQYAPHLKPLKLQRQMRLIDLDVQSSSSNDDNYSTIFDDLSAVDGDVDADEHHDGIIMRRRPLQSTTHSRSSSASESSVFDRPWTKFSQEISLVHAKTGSDRVDNIIRQYQDVGYDILREGPADECLSDDLYTNDTTIIDAADVDDVSMEAQSPLRVRNAKLSLSLQSPLLCATENLLLSPTSSFNMLNTDRLGLAPVSRDSSVNSLSSTYVNGPHSPEHGLVNDLVGSQYPNKPSVGSISSNETLSKYVNIECATNTSTGLPLSSPKFSFDYRQNSDNVLNLTIEKTPAGSIDPRPSPLTTRAIWHGGEAEMINGEAVLDDSLLI